MKQKILIIEDDPIIQAELVTLLEGNDYKALAVMDFTTVVQTVKVFLPHLILLDIKLPQTNGFTLCSQIRSFSNVPIIFVTSCTTDMDELNSIMLGGDAFITKPYNTAILLARIASLLKRAYPTEAQTNLTLSGSYSASGYQQDRICRTASRSDEERTENFVLSVQTRRSNLRPYRHSGIPMG